MVCLFCEFYFLPTNSSSPRTTFQEQTFVVGLGQAPFVFCG